MKQNRDQPKPQYPYLGYGLGLRAQHIPYILQHGAGVDWFEIISENYIDNYGYARYTLDQIREKTPIVMHGVSMSIGSDDPLNFEYLYKLKALSKEIAPIWISDHLCWTGTLGINSHDLLPMPLNEESLKHVIERVKIVQDYLERPMVFENPSTYLTYRHSTMKEWEFLSILSQETECGLLLDLNNVFVSSYNHGFDPKVYIASIPMDKIVQIHLAGPTKSGKYLIDTHDQPVPNEVWELYKFLHTYVDKVSTMIEWDANIPDYPEVLAELSKAKQVLEGKSLPTLEIQSIDETSVSTPIDHQLVQI